MTEITLPPEPALKIILRHATQIPGPTNTTQFLKLIRYDVCTILGKTGIHPTLLYAWIRGCVHAGLIPGRRQGRNVLIFPMAPDAIPEPLRLSEPATFNPQPSTASWSIHTLSRTTGRPAHPPYRTSLTAAITYANDHANDPNLEYIVEPLDL